MATQKQRPPAVADLLARPGGAPVRGVAIEDFPRAGPAAPADPEPAAMPDRAEGGIKAATIGTTLYLLPDEHTRVRQLALDMGVPTVNELLLLGLDALLDKRGRLPIERYSAPRPAKAGRPRATGPRRT